MNITVLILSLIGTVFTSLILLPQLIKTWKSGSAKDVSYWMIAINIIQSIFWLISTFLGAIYLTGWGGMSVPLIITNIISGSCALILGIKKYKLSKKALDK